MPGHIGTSIVINSGKILAADPKEMTAEDLRPVRGVQERQGLLGSLTTSSCAAMGAGRGLSRQRAVSAPRRRRSSSTACAKVAGGSWWARCRGARSDGPRGARERLRARVHGAAAAPRGSSPARSSRDSSPARREHSRLLLSIHRRSSHCPLSAALFTPRGGETWRDPFGMYGALRDGDPVHRVADNGEGEDYWVLSRFATSSMPPSTSRRSRRRPA